MAKDRFEVGDQVVLYGRFGPEAVKTVEKVYKNGNFILSNHHAYQFRQNGHRAGGGFTSNIVYPATEERLAEFYLAVGKSRVRQNLEGVKSRVDKVTDPKVLKKLNMALLEFIEEAEKCTTK
jgi:hypothetical protein